MPRIHLPLEGGLCQVSVTSNKIYGSLTGQELITEYGVKHRPKDIQSIEVKGNILFIPYGNLSDKITIGDRTVKTKDFINKLEQTLRIKILSKRQNRATKYYQNCSLIIQNLDSLL